jgi:hypothetical protein
LKRAVYGLRRPGDAANAAGQGAPAAEEMVRRCDAFLFQIMPKSIASGARMMAELHRIQRKWRKPNERILPVAITPVLTSCPQQRQARIQPSVQAQG